MKIVPASFPSFLTLLLVCAAPTLASAATYKADLNKTFPVAPGEQLRMEVDRGSIDLITSARQDVVIRVERKLSDVKEATAKEVFEDHEVTFVQGNGILSVNAKYKHRHDSSGWRKNPFNELQVRYVVELPEKFSVDLNTAGGGITAGDLEGTVKARTSGGNLAFAKVTGPLDAVTAGGSIKLATATGPVSVKTSGGNISLGELQAATTAETSGGSISVETCKAKLNVRTSGGNIRLGSLEGPTEARTSGGEIRVKSAGARLFAHSSGGRIAVEDTKAAVELETSAGSVSVEFSNQPPDDCRLTTSAGNVTVAMPESLSFELEARTSAGRIETDIPVQSTVIGKADPSRLKGKLNSGGKRLTLSASAGDISIRKR